MSATYDTLLQILDDRSVDYNALHDVDKEGSEGVSFFINGGMGSYRVFASVDSESELFQIFCYVPIRFQNHLLAIGEVVNRANYGLRVGKFEMDVDDGHVRFQIHQILEGVGVGEEIIDRMITTALAMCERYLPAFLAVHCGSSTAKIAVAEVETNMKAAARGEGAEDEAEQADAEDEDLETLLQQAVAAEDYERAAAIRDQMNVGKEKSGK